MNIDFKEAMWKQFVAAIDMLENAIRTCPIELWNSDTKFWYSEYHTIFYLDYYLSSEPEKFLPPEPFTLSEFDPKGVFPDSVYSKDEILTYLEFGRRKCYDLIIGLTEESLTKRFINEYKNYSILENSIV